MTTADVAREPAFAAGTGAPAARMASDRVIIATLNRLDGVTGVHAHTRILSEGLRKAGIGCDVITTFSGSRLWMPIFAVRPLLLKRFFPTAATLWYRHWHTAALRTNLRRMLRGSSVRQIIAQCPPSAQAAMDVRHELGLTDRVDVTMVCHFNESEADEYRNQGALSGPAFDRVKAEEEAVLREVDRVVYVSGWARDLVEVQRGIRTRASSVVWNGVPERTSDVAPVRRSDIGLTDDDLVLMNVGTLEPRKDQLGLVKLFAKVAAQYPAARLELIGEGPDRPAIEAAAKELGLIDKIKLLGHRSDVPALLQLADLYVHYAMAENCPISVLEVARTGLAWAAKPSGGVRELLEALDGVALANDSIDESIQALEPLLCNADRRRAAGALAKEHFKAHFTQDAMVKAYANILGLANPARGAR
ncbi:MAG: pimA 1 [Phycisphaerales bacterium]|nr:pimA 1 [Phycisphaerales bacterium]